MSRRESISALLLRTGWRRIDDAAHRQDCGMPGPTSGYCMRNARWARLGNGMMCAQHAAEVTIRTGAR